MISSLSENEKSPDHLTLSSLQVFAFMYFLKCNIVLKLILTEVDMDSEVSLSV